MIEEDFKRLLDILENALNADDFEEDIQNIQYLSDALKTIQKEIPTIDELEKIKETEVELEIKYEEFYELSNYFDPIYIMIKNKIHQNEVKRIREENRKRREAK